MTTRLERRRRGEDVAPPPRPAPDPAEKVRLIEALGFTRSGSDHQPDCPYALDAGLRCICVPPAPVWHAPQDVLAHLGETWEDRRKRADQPRPIPAVER